MRGKKKLILNYEVHTNENFRENFNTCLCVRKREVWRRRLNNMKLELKIMKN